MVENSIMGILATFIGIAVFLSVGIMILDGSLSDCSNLEGYNASNPASSTDWAKSCLDNNSGIQNSWILISVVLILIASIIILAVVRML